jgi:AcrR family transcriptional regulator
MDAALELLVEEGWEALTHFRVAERAGIGRSTVYRHWPDRADMLYDVLAGIAAGTHTEDSGDLRADLVTVLRRVRDIINDPTWGRMLTTMIERAESQATIRAVKHGVTADFAAMFRSVIQRAQERRQIAKHLDIDLAVAQLMGPVGYRRLLSGEPIDDAFIDAVVDGCLVLWRKEGVY